MYDKLLLIDNKNILTYASYALPCVFVYVPYSTLFVPVFFFLFQINGYHTIYGLT